MKATIRSYQDFDKEQCQGLLRELVEWHREIYSDPSIGGEHPEDHFDKHLRLVGKENLWVACAETKVVGLIGLVEKEFETEIEPLIVSKSFRLKAVGRQLVSQVILEAKKEEIKKPQCITCCKEQKDYGVFPKLGFKNLGYVCLFIDLTGQTWKSGFRMHELNFNY